MRFIDKQQGSKNELLLGKCKAKQQEKLQRESRKGNKKTYSSK
jgi:hypothetical protein